MEWQQRVNAVWASAGERSEAEVVAAIDALVADRPNDDPVAVFEAASARDFAGRESEAEPLYRRAIELGLPEPRRAQAFIQLASTLRNLGRADESVALLTRELVEHPERELADAARAFLALALHDAERPTDALRTALLALAPHLPQYRRPVAAYAEGLETCSRR
jgi:tetratricopeptide (TPR) repeat protein